jgi:hypothetical protein
MELTVRTHGGSATLTLPEHARATVHGLKSHLHASLHATLGVPDPSDQRLVYHGRVVGPDASVADLCSSHAAAVVVLGRRAVAPPSRPSASAAPSPSSADIKAAIACREEARRAAGETPTVLPPLPREVRPPGESDAVRALVSGDVQSFIQYMESLTHAMGAAAAANAEGPSADLDSVLTLGRRLAREAARQRGGEADDEEDEDDDGVCVL